MKKFSGQQIYIAVSICIIGFILPFFTRNNDETINSTLSTSFTILSTIVTIITLIVAMILFDKFGIDAKFKEKQIDLVLKLVDDLKSTRISIKAGALTYENYLFHCNNLRVIPFEFYANDKTKTVLYPSNFGDLFESTIISYVNNPWLPTEIKKKCDFLLTKAFLEVEKFDNLQFVTIDVNYKGVEPWIQTYPKMSFEMFTNNMAILLTTIVEWLETYSTIVIDFKLVDKH